MGKRNYLLGCLLWLAIQSSFGQNPPEATISNGLIKASLYLPDSERGYYRATRFDWAGIVYDLQYKGHSYFGKWFSNYDPKVHESVMGPVDEFGPLGYQEAGVDETFVKIGVGSLIKEDCSAYSSYHTYPISDFGNWEKHHKSNQIAFIHTLEDPDYGYKYVKSLTLAKNLPRLVISHQLINNASKPIVTEVYNHNFFFIDNQPIGSDYKLRFPYPVFGEGKGIGSLAAFNGSEINFLTTLGKTRQVYVDSIQGHSPHSNTYQLQIENTKTGAGVQIQADGPLSRMAFWAAYKTVCPEPYIRIKLLPGESKTWNIIYDFFEN